MHPEKAALRREIRARMKAIPAEERARQSVAVAAHLRHLIDVADPRPVALFASLPFEIDTRPLDEWLRAEGVRRALPALHLGEMVFRPPPNDVAAAEMPAGQLGIPSPPDEGIVIGPEDCQWVICPGLAFDRCGRRLGQGKGYYDRALRAARARGEVRAVAIFLDIQEVDAVPTDDDDERIPLLCSAEGGTRAALPPASLREGL